MISGQVTAARQAVVEVTLVGVHGRRETVLTVVDTGFSGYLALPARLINSLGLPLLDRVEATLADGRTAVLSAHRGVVLWDGRPLAIDVLQAEGGPLLGMATLYGHELRVVVLDGGAVTIDPHPRSDGD